MTKINLSSSSNSNPGSNSKIAYRDSAYYSPVDVIKGIDLLTEKVVRGDDLAPEGYPFKPKCCRCSYYQEEKHEHDKLGLCVGISPAFKAYGDMSAESCERYKIRE